MKKRRLAALALCLLLLLQLMASPAGAAESVYFVAMGNEVLPLSDETMPFWSGGYLYIAASMFGNAARKNPGVFYTGSSQRAILYSGGDRSLIFDLEKNYTQDSAGNVSYPGALLRDRTVYVPAYLVAKYFGLVYSVTEVKNGHLVWIRQPGYNLTDKQFANAAEYPCAASYAEYIKKKKADQAEEIPAVEEPSSSEILGNSVYLCFEAGNDTAAILDVLDRYHSQAAFFCAPEFLESQGDLLRRMTATGNSIGILVDAADETHTVTEQLEAGNQALRRATCGGTRLTVIRNGKETDMQEAQAAGYRCVEPSLNRSNYELKTASNARSLLQKASLSRSNVSIWLGERVSGQGLQAFLNALEDADGRCLALTETL